MRRRRWGSRWRSPWKTQTGAQWNNHWKSRNPGKKGKRRNAVFLVLVIMFVLTVQTFLFVEKNLREPLMSIAQIRIKQVATDAINKAMTEKISQGTNFERLIDWKMDNNGKITGFMLNYLEHSRIASEAVGIVDAKLKEIQEIPESIPIGQAFDSAILSSFGPEVPIRFVPEGAVKVDLNTRQRDAGINMLLVEVYIRIIAEVMIIIPFDTKPEVVSTEVPISYLLVKGDVPMYYFDNKGKPLGDFSESGTLPPTISLPDNVTSKPEEQQVEPTMGPALTITK
ncbi:sporulation protein YunB [Paenibacillus turpanensis]|uniref:sporulation protein YunB n=1 Tax=Paenibacillus turpanensis TaxID=2689078 RepID=UPI0031329AA8